MATLQNIRSKGPLLVIVIGLALFAFIAGDAWKVLQPHQSHDVGEVNGETLSAQDYQNMVEEYTEVIKFSSGMSSLNDEQTNQVKDEVWRSYVNNKLIESPKSFKVACTVMTQIIAAVASNQYGGQSVNISHLGKYLRKSAEKYRRHYTEMLAANNSPEMIDKLVNDRVKSELKDGVQTMQYQINTLMTTNGQSPFVTLFMYIEDGYEYETEVAMIIEEILKQRLEGIKNEKGIYVTPAFPKLIYVLDENNCLNGGKYDYITRLAVQCSAKRMYPDYISAKMYAEKLYFLCCFLHIFSAYFVTIWQNKIS